METSRETISYSRQTGLLLFFILMAAVAYVYFLNMSVVHVVLQKQTLHDMQELRNEIALLESDYIKAQHLIAERMASVEGVATKKSKLFVSRNAVEELAANQ